LATALQESLLEPFLHLSIDKLIDFMPANINNWTGGPAPLGFSWEAAIDPTGHPVHQIKAGPFAKRITRTLKDIARLFLSQDYNLIIDDVAFGVEEVKEWKNFLKSYPVLYVGVTAPLEILEQREKERGDRFHGGARDQYFKVHENVTYDLEIDTNAFSIEESIARIKLALELKLKSSKDNDL
jgi:chloramphenicol 3-O phosphotransferase